MAEPVLRSTAADAFALRWAEYRKLRRAWLLALAGFIACAAAAVGASGIGGREWKWVAPLLAAPCVLAGFVCWALGLAAWLKLLAWRCPRCRKRFTVGGLSSGPTNRCKHCGVLVGTRSDAPPPWTRFRIG